MDFLLFQTLFFNRSYNEDLTEYDRMDSLSDATKAK